MSLTSKASAGKMKWEICAGHCGRSFERLVKMFGMLQNSFWLSVLLLSYLLANVFLRNIFHVWNAARLACVVSLRLGYLHALIDCSSQAVFRGAFSYIGVSMKETEVAPSFSSMRYQTYPAVVASASQHVMLNWNIDYGGRS